MQASDSEYEEFLESLEPFSVGLNSCSTSLDRKVHRQIREKKLRPVSHIASNYSVDWVGKEAFDVIAEMRVTAEHPQTKARLLLVECKFETHFHGAKPIHENHVARFAQGEFRVVVWPYFREFISSMTTRMGIPPLLIPAVIGEKENETSSPKKERATGRKAASTP
jgi:preprotein translocase subunit SecB